MTPLMDQVQVKVLFFASAKEVSGKSEDSLQVKSKLSYEELKALICDKFSLEVIRNNFILALNQDYIEAGPLVLKNNDELAVIPPLSDVSEISNLVAHESCGAVALFCGTTRDNFDGKQVVQLEYEAYDDMAKKEMSNICYEIRRRWPDVVNIAMHHRLGLVPVKESSVVIAISSPHRRSSLDALPFALDELKKMVPIWKKEFYKVEHPGGEGESQWKENPECTWSKKALDNHNN